jgi:hypothetical protein
MQRGGKQGPRPVRSPVLSFPKTRDTHEARHCGDKIRYASRSVARNAVRRLGRQWQADTLEEYLCYYCDHWHIGNTIKP